MLSLGSRDEGRKGIGLGLGFGSREGAMEENELEEGEAFSGHEDDACIDPDIALSYIDEKLQDVLGHFQKDFEGGVSAENLGAKFGGYGSFLPSYQRSPTILSQPRSPPRPSHHTVSKSPCNPSAECVRQNSSVPRGTSVSKNNTSLIAQPSNSGRAENHKSSQSAVDCAPHLDSNNKTVSGSDQKSLKVRIKVGPDNTLARNNAAIYSGLGLDTPPFSSPEDSPDACPGVSPEVRDAPGESPSTILQDMTCFSVPGGYLLSPINQKIFQLAENESLFSRKAGFLSKSVSEAGAICNMALPMREMKCHADKKIKSDEKNGRSMEEETLNSKGDAAKMLKTEMDIDSQASNRVVSSALNMSLQSCSRSSDPKVERQIIDDLVKDANRTLEVIKEPKKSSENNRLPLPDSGKADQVISMGSLKNGGLNNLGNGITHSKSKLNPNSSLLGKKIEETSSTNHKDISSDTCREVQSKNQNGSDISKLNGDEFMGRNDRVADHTKPKQLPAHRVVSHEKDAEKTHLGNDQARDGKRRKKGNHDKSGLPTESIQTQENLRTSSLVPKDKKKSSHAKAGHSENKSRELKPRKESNKVHSRGSHRDDVENKNVQRVENRTGVQEPHTFTEKSMEISKLKKDVNTHPEPMANTTTAPISAAAAPLDAPPPVVIQENWVCCDKCQMWRLLPYGADPHNLPKKWKCSMQVWLPGLNKCFISEEETTKAFNALYMVPAPETGAKLNGHHDVASSSIIPADAQQFDRRLDRDISGPITGKKKGGLIGTPNVPKNPFLKKNLQNSAKNRSLTDMSEYPLETNSSIKGCLGLTSLSTGLTPADHSPKLKENHEITGRYSNEGESAGKSGKHSKPKTKREVNQDGFRISEKIKKENSNHLVEDRLSDLDMVGMTTSAMNNGLSAKTTGKILPNYSDHSSSKDSKSEPRGNSLAYTKKSKDPVQIYSNGGDKDHFKDSDVKKSSSVDYAAKKRKVREWQESQLHQETVASPKHTWGIRPNVKEALSEGESKKQKKTKVSKSEGKECSMSNTEGKLEKKGRSTKIVLSGSREQYQETAVYQQALDGNDPLKRDVTYAQLPAAATSSSSKVSGSRKSKASLQEVRGSPVESVSSSPLRTFTTEKASVRIKSVAKDSMAKVDSSFMGSPKRYSDGELGSDQSGTRRKEIGSSVQLKSLDRRRAVEYGLHLSDSNKDGVHVSGVQADPSHAEYEEVNVVVDAENISDHDNKYLYEEPVKDNIDDDRDKLNNHRRSSGTSQRKSDKSSSVFNGRNKTFDADANKCKIDVSDSLGDKKKLYSTKNGREFRSEAEFNCNDKLNCPEDLRDKNCGFQEKDADFWGKKNSSAKLSRFDRRENHSNNELTEALDAQKGISTNSSVTASRKSKLQENFQQAPYLSENPVVHSLLNGMNRSEMASGRGTSSPIQPSKDKSKEQSLGPRTEATPNKISRSDTNPTDAANEDAFNMAKQSKKPDSQNSVPPNSTRQATPNGHDSSPMRKDGSAAAKAALREATGLKHHADRLKNDKGRDHESIELYFQAALKFLHAASLLEPPSVESAKPMEMNSSMQMMQTYSDTARLCEFCAHGYERYKEMAAAALAYKCVEVAYMKVAYYKHTGATKDRNELLTTLQSAMPGESPSSSASDVDNLNNQGALDKAASSVKSAGSPQIAVNHVIAARNRPNFMRLLNYTNDLNCAFDATKRSQNALAVASVSLDKDGADGTSSVRKVLDFNFHNVEGLLRLVRLSMESINQ